ncbi:MAG: hypothetical protein K6E73_10945 [Bacteroidales bacterium]|nr:hypothetical protein [Bacteroidales bacterium]
MILHIFNPEHDIALAYNNKYFTAPHAGRQLRNDLDYLPALWAGDGDCVLVENVDSARVHARRFMRHTQHVRFVSKHDIVCLAGEIDRVFPWGWDSAVKFQLEQMGVPVSVMPADEALLAIRELSNRKFASLILQHLRGVMPNSPLLGESFYVESVEGLQSQLYATGKSIIKAPWSSSGRGVRYVDTVMDTSIAKWASNTIARQGGIMVEPYYNKVRDFGMEFVSDADGVHYVGLSVFHTLNGAYMGNSLADEEHKRGMLEAYVSAELLNEVSDNIENLLTAELRGIYTGALGVDMMIVANSMGGKHLDGGFCLHPMVEINLRRTMGHVALALSAKGGFERRMMRIDYDGSHYHLHTVCKEGNVER